MNSIETYWKLWDVFVLFHDANDCKFEYNSTYQFYANPLPPDQGRIWFIEQGQFFQDKFSVPKKSLTS